MRRFLAVALVVAACGGGDLAVEGELAAATFLAEASPADVEFAGRDRLAGTGDENRLEVIRLTDDVALTPMFSGVPVPEPFEFVRDPLAAGSVDRILGSADRVVAVIYPLIDRTPNGRVLAGRLVALDADGAVVGTDWDEDSDGAAEALMAWGTERGLSPLETWELAAAGLRDPAAEGEAAMAADFLR